jgi:8-oxo-dGTP diphosphatase
MAVIISHTAIIDKRGRTLVLRRSASEKVLPGFWDLPGGTVRLKEGPTAGAIREVKEECGLKVSGLKLLACTSNWDRKKQENFVTLIFITKKYSGRIKLNHRDHEEYAWLEKKELKKINTVGYFQEILKLL